MKRKSDLAGWPAAIWQRVLSLVGRRAFAPLLPLLSALLLGLGCAAHQPPLFYADSRSHELRREALGSPRPSELNPAAITPEMRTWLLARIPQSWNQTKKLRALHRLLFDESGLGLVYDPGATLTAAETFASGRGNCLAVTHLFVGLARQLGLEAGFQRVSLNTEWDRQADLMIRYEHINARGQLQSGMEYVVDFLPRLALRAGGEARLVQDSLARALYFSNLGVEALLREDFVQARAELQLALALAPELADAWVNLGTVFRRMERRDLAEFSFREALLHDSLHQTAFGNLVSLYQQAGETARADDLQKRLVQARNRNPWYHFVHWQNALSEGRTEEAVVHLNRAIKRKNDEPDFYFALAETLQSTGEQEAAASAAAYAEALQAELEARPAIRDAGLLLYEKEGAGVQIQVRSGSRKTVQR